MVYPKVWVFLYFLECGYIHVIVVYGQNFHKIMYCDVIRHVSPLIPEVVASIFRKNFKRVWIFFFMFTLFIDNHYKVIISSGEHRHVPYKSYKTWHDRNYLSIPFLNFVEFDKKLLFQIRGVRENILETQCQMPTKYKIISFGIKPTRSLTLVSVERLMIIHVKYNGYGYMLSLLFG